MTCGQRPAHPILLDSGIVKKQAARNTALFRGKGRDENPGPQTRAVVVLVSDAMLTWTKGVVSVISALAAMCMVADIAGAIELPAGRPIPIKELRERTSALVGRDVVVGTADAVEPITETNFDDWKLVSPCVGSYYVTLTDETSSIDVLVKGPCLLKIQGINGPWILKGEKVWMNVSIFVPGLNPFELNPLVRAIAKDFGAWTAE